MGSWTVVALRAILALGLIGSVAVQGLMVCSSRTWTRHRPQCASRWW